MFRPLVRSHHRPPRRGTAILITCFFLITIMMVTGLALVMYAAREKAAALAYQEGGTRTLRAAPAPEGTVNAFLSALIYDTADDGSALQNSLRGHSIARGMYGSRPDYTNFGTVPNWPGSTTPWAGVGLFNEDTNLYTYDGSTTYGALTALTPEQRNRSRFVNHTALQLSNQFLLLDPEWMGNRFPNSGSLPAFSTNAGGRTYVGKHAGYTYPDLKSFFLGAQDPTTGEVIQPSFHRDWLFRDSTRPVTESPLAPTNPNWTNEIGKLLTLRPRPTEHPNFPRVPPNADGTYTGDVQNLTGNYVFVQSLNGGRGGFVAKNDSLWMHIGLPPITLPDGRTVQPMVAPLILPLDGRFDLSIHGNRLGASSAHSSYGGYGPWEVNLGFGTANEPDRQALTFSDPTATPPTGRYASQNAEFNPFASGQLLPIYGGVAWNGSQAAFKLPSEQLIAPDNRLMLGLPSIGDAAYSGGQYGNFQNENQQIANHPAGYNSNEFAPRDNTTNPKSPVYPYSDLKRFSLRYAFTPDWYGQAFATNTARDTFSPDPTTSVYEYLPNPGATTLPSTGKQSYRLDPTHTRRNLFVPRAMSLDRPALAPNFVSRDGTTAFQITAGQTKPGALFATPVAYPSPQAVGALTDFASATQWYNIQAALGSVDLNRPLADYRVNTTQAIIPLPLADGTKSMTDPTNNTNVTATSAALADKDRQALAKDIFARFIVATGAAARVTFDTTNGVQIALPDPTNYQIPTTTPQVTATPQQYNALRYLAQLAVNIVDHIDNDDVSTAFQWNSTNPNDLPAGRAADLTQATNRVVFGVEKPRLVLNEVYGEIANDPETPIVEPNGMGINQPLMNAKAHVRFWAELVNPTQPPHTAVTGVLGDGTVPLSAYQILISRANRSNAYLPNNPAPAGSAAPVAGNTVSYLTNNPAEPRSAENVLGVFDPNTGRPDVTFNMSGATTNVKPNLEQYAPAAPLPNNGIVLLRTNPLKMGSTATVKTLEFNPDPAAAGSVWANAVTSAAPDEPNSLGYTINMPKKMELANPEFRQHAVLLQRLANPYLPTSATNPYVTVDMMDYVPAFDAVNRADGDADPRVRRPAMMPKNDGTEYDPVGEMTGTLNRFSVGKVQPLAGYSFATINPQTTYSPGTYNLYQFNGATAPAQNSMVLNQTRAGAANEPMHTFGTHNGNGATQPAAATVTVTPGMQATLPANQTVMLPFDWLPHLDRPLETQGDLFMMRDCKPYQLTHEFVRNTTTGLVYDTSYAQWALHNNGLARALELLKVKSPDLRVAHGGRVGGRVNLSAVQDSRIVQGLWDAPATVTTGNRFNQTFVTDNVWNGLFASRSQMQPKYGPDATSTIQSPVPTASVLDVPGGGASGIDRPIMPFGTPTADTGGFAYANPNAARDGDTLLRINSTTGVPYLYQTTETNPYTKTEPFRKVVNNVTTVSHAFAVYLTIGYFEVTVSTPGWLPTSVNGGQVPQFGPEVFDQIPGDMRQKFMAVVDMSNMALKPLFPTSATDTDPHATVRPFFTALAATARPPATATDPVTLTLASGGGNGTTFSIPTDGQTVIVNIGDDLILGYGSEAQRVRVQSVGTAGPTVNQITVTGLTRDVWGGTCVSNVRPGYAGPRTDFDFNAAKYKPVVPYVERLK